MQFKIGKPYHRRDDLAALGGSWGMGIITAKANPYVFIITGERGEEFGYEDEFLPDGTFVYSGQGVEGDMDWRYVNRARDHHELDKELHLFEKAEDSYMVRYRGQYEYDFHRFTQSPDRNGKLRRAILFHLIPAGGNTVTLPQKFENLSLEELYEEAVKNAPHHQEGREPETRTKAIAGVEYNRSEIPKQFALRAASGVCQGCENEAPFLTPTGEPFREVHHIDFLSDGGADHPDNVIAVCHNCHR
ncbi:HNH endonuclease signature motif containing protein [Haladaptatus sp. ZSTT2]|uniref:HNH endonuclease signature motif containing protein n=1 Tax=Haladaptatus sp. ZSTT2 TaxID=3120515 RepID=UPI00300E8A74